MSLGAVTMRDEPREQISETAYYVYGVVLAVDGRVPAGLSGIDGVPVQTLVQGDVAAVVTEIVLERPAGRRADVVAHSAVLDTLATSGSVVPVQFGSVMPDGVSVIEDLLAPGEQQFVDLLEQLWGRVQFNLRATYHEAAVLAEVVAVDPEIADLRARTRDLPEESAYGERVRLGELVARAMEVKRADDAGVLLDALVPHVVAYEMRGGAGIDHLLDVALLVEAERTEELENHLEGLAEAVHERVRLRLVGPVAPYDFVGGL